MCLSLWRLLPLLHAAVAVRVCFWNMCGLMLPNGLLLVDEGAAAFAVRQTKHKHLLPILRLDFPGQAAERLSARHRRLLPAKLQSDTVIKPTRDAERTEARRHT